MPFKSTLSLALFISCIFHLSAVSLFSIGIWFPLEEREYHRFEIRDPMGRTRFSSLDSLLTLSDLVGKNTPTDRTNSLEIEMVLPDVELPSLRFSEVDRLQLRRGLAESRSRFELSRSQGLSELGSSLGSTLSKLSGDLLDLNPFTQDEETDETLQPPGPVAIASPAPGYEARMEWLTGDETRQVLLAPGIDVLRTIDPAEWGEPISLVLKVNRDGKVVEILSPLDSGVPAMVKVYRAILKYRFAPVSQSEDSAQHGTLFIAPTVTP
jgi:hypothetical protein